MKLGPYEVGPGHPPVVICEIGANHGGKLDQALQLIDAAVEVKAHIVKFQCYEPSDITLDCDRPEFVLRDGPWRGRRLWDLYTAAQTPLEWFPRLAEHCAKREMPWCASVFSQRTVDLCHELGACAMKIASAEITDLPLIEYAARFWLPMIISTGMASEEEIDAAYNAAAGNDCIHLQCVSGYPSAIEEANLWKVSRDAAQGLVGISDHSFGVEIPIAATALGACIIEKHLRGPFESEDAAFSLFPNEFSAMVQAVRRTWEALQPCEALSEAGSRQARRSLYCVRPIRRGELFTEDNVRAIRPAGGMAPKCLPEILGRPAPRDFVFGEPILLR